MQQVAELGGGSYYDARDSSTLAAALKDAITATYDVLDATGRVVATGQIDGPPQEAPPGYYAVEIAAWTGPNRTYDVRIDQGSTDDASGQQSWQRDGCHSFGTQHFRYQKRE